MRLHLHPNIIILKERVLKCHQVTKAQREPTFAMPSQVPLQRGTPPQQSKTSLMSVQIGQPHEVNWETMFIMVANVLPLNI